MFFLRIGCNPVVSECDGHYEHEARKNQLIWSLPIIDSTNKTGSLEFSAPKAIPNDFFPLTLYFTSKSSFAKIKVGIHAKKIEFCLIFYLFLDH